MTNTYRAAIIVTLSVFKISAESPLHTYTGYLVNAKCMQAAPIVSRNSRGYNLSAGVNGFVGASHKPLKTTSMRKAILRHCSINPGVTEFALLDRGGNFVLLDEPGNLQVRAQDIRKSKETTVTIDGSIDRTTLTVRSLVTVKAK
jgi:hypothetical protein